MKDEELKENLLDIDSLLENKEIAKAQAIIRMIILELDGIEFYDPFEEN